MNRKKRQQQKQKEATRTKQLANVERAEIAPARKQHEYIESVFGNIVFDDFKAPISSVHQFTSLVINAYRYGDDGVAGAKLVGRYQVAITEFNPEGLTEKLKPILVELEGDEEAVKQVWFNAFKEGVKDALAIYAHKKHGPGTVMVMNDLMHEPSLYWYGDLLDLTLHDMSVAITSMTRGNMRRLCLSVPFGQYVIFTSRPLEPNFSHKDFFEAGTAHGTFMMRGKHYLFKLVGRDGAMDGSEELDRPNLATSLRQTVNAVLHDVTGNRNAIETLRFY